MKQYVVRAVALVVGAAGLVFWVGSAPVSQAAPVARLGVVTGAPSVGTVVFDQPAAGQSPGLGSQRDLVIYRDGQLTQLTHNVPDANQYTPSAYGPSLSPDGTRIAYTGCEHVTFGGGPSLTQSSIFDPNEICSLWVMNLDGTGAHSVYDSSGDSIRGSGWNTTDFDWGPGGRVAFADDGVAKTIDPATGAVQVVADKSAHYWDAVRWLGTGRLVLDGRGVDAYGDPVTDFGQDIWSVGSAGTGLTNLTHSTNSYDEAPVGSEDGTKVAFVGNDRDDNVVPFVMNADGSAVKQLYLSSTYYPDVIPTGWSTDYDHLGLLVGDTDGAMQFAVAAAAGSHDAEPVLDLADEPGIDWRGDADAAPVAHDRSFSVTPGDSVSTTLWAEDPDDDALAYTVQSQPAHGTLTGAAPDLTYTPSAGYTGPDSFTYTATANGKISNVATVSILTRGQADLVASVHGVGAKTHIGQVDLAKATVTNHGPDPATDVILRLGVPRGLKYGYVRKPGPAWTCSITSLRFIACRTSSLASGSSATLTASLYALQQKATPVRVAVRAQSSAVDPHTSDNYVAIAQRLRSVVTPKPPPAQLQARTVVRTPHGARLLDAALNGRSGRGLPWTKITSRCNCWIKVTDVFNEPPISNQDLQGSASATMWAWQDGRSVSHVVRVKYTNVYDQSNGGLGGSNLFGSGTWEVAEGHGPEAMCYPKTWTIGADWSDGHMVGKWKFVRFGARRNVSYKSDLY